jgi:hypothetical protein
VKPEPKSVPWSAEAEKHFRGWITVWWIFFWIEVVIVIGCVIESIYIAALGFTILAAVALIALLHCTGKLYAMMENKPRSGAPLTKYTWLPAYAFNVLCPDCGRIVEIDQWMDNPIDAGGGRFSKVCECGRGYYRLRSQGPRA